MTHNPFVRTFVIIFFLLTNFLPVAQPAAVHAAPPTPVKAKPNTAASAPAATALPTPIPPRPDTLPAAAQEARVRQAAEAALQKYADYYGPRYQTSVADVAVDGEWALVTAQEQEADQEPVYLLGRREGNMWQVEMPNAETAYSQWLDQVPEELVTFALKAKWRQALGWKTESPDRAVLLIDQLVRAGILHPQLSWRNLGVQTQTVSLNGIDSSELSGVMYESNLFTDKLPGAVMKFYSEDHLAELGWTKVGGYAGTLSNADIYHMPPDRYLRVEFLGHIDPILSEEYDFPTASTASINVWMSIKTEDTVLRGQPTPLVTSEDSTQGVPLYGNPLVVSPFSQNDRLWSSNRQGWPDPGFPDACNTSILARFGCWTATYAMLYNYFSPGYTTPADLNGKLNTGPDGGPRYGKSKNSGHCNDSMPTGSPYAPTGVGRGRDYYNECTKSNCVDSGNVAIIDREIAAGRPVLAYVHFSGTTPQHMVMITGHQGNTYYINDPSTGERLTLATGALGAYVLDRIYEWSGTPSSTSTCSSPVPSLPNNDYVSPGNNITFAWSHPGNCSGQDGYLLRVGTFSGGSDVVSDYRSLGLQTNYEFPSQWYNRDLYWSVRANASGAPWSDARKFRIEPNQGGGDTCASYVDEFSFNPASPSGATDVTINVRIKTSFPNFRAARVRLPDGGTPSSSDFNHSYAWNTRDTPDGDHEIVLEIDDNQGSAWDRPETCRKTYHLNPRPVPPPAAPSLLQPANGQPFNEGDAINLCWSATGSEYSGEVTGGPSPVPFGPQTATCKNLGPQWAGYTYSWRVQARNTAGASWSETRTFTVKPAAPTLNNAQPTACNQVSLSWSDRSGNEEGYRIYRNGSLVAHIGMDVTSYQDQGLSGATGYSYYVKAYRGAIESDGSNTMNVVTPACVVAPTAPALLVPLDGATFYEDQAIELC